MPRPTPSDLHVDRALTNVAVNWRQDEKMFMAPLFGDVPSANQSDKYHIWSREDIYRSESTKVGDTSRAPIRGENVTQGTFSCDVYGVRELLGEQSRANADEAIDLEEGAAENVTLDLMIGREVDFATKFFATGLWTTERAGHASAPTGTEFLMWDVTGSTPIENMRAAIRAMVNLTGYRPNVIGLGGAVWDALADHPDLLDRIKHTEKGIVTEDLLAATLGLEEVRVGEAIQNTAIPNATAAFAPMLGKHALLAYRPPSPGKNKPAAGYNFMWSGLLGGNGGQRVKRYTLDEQQGALVIEGNMAYDQKLVSADLGAFFLNAVT